MEVSRVVKTVCGMCFVKCGIEVNVEDGKVVKIKGGMREHPVSHGRVCPKAMQVTNWLYHPERLRHPMKQGKGSWKKISWDEALDTIVDKLKKTKETYGAEAFHVHKGVGGYYGAGFLDLIWRFLDLFGSPNLSTADSFCFHPRAMGHTLTYGSFYPTDLENANCILIIGANIGMAICITAAERAIERGAKSIVVDPRRTSMAKKADIHVQPRPGTDCALLLSIINVIVSEKLYDQEFVDRWTIGFDKLEEHVKQYPPEGVEKITGVPAASIREIARTFATVKPACIFNGITTLEQTPTGVQSNRAIAILYAITGNFGVKGGLVAPCHLPCRSLRLPDKIEGIGKPFTASKFPLFYKIYDQLLFTFGQAQANLLPEAILHGNPYPIKALLVEGGNPALTWPGSQQVQEALSKLDFLVVMDVFMTDTAKFADIVLPAATFLENTRVPLEYAILLPTPYIMLSPKVVEPLEECWPEAKFWLELSKKMGYGEYFPWKDWEEVLNYILEPSGLTIEDLREKPEGIIYGTIKYRQYEQTGLPTPSGKIELYSETLEKLGYDPLPTHREPFESPVSTPELAEEYPLILSATARVPQFFNSQFHNIAQLRKAVPEPVAEVHPSTAAQYGITNGDMVVVATKRGSIRLKAKTTLDIISGVVSVPHGWTEANVNLLTEGKPGDPISGFPVLKALCKMSRES